MESKEERKKKVMDKEGGRGGRETKEQRYKGMGPKGRI